MWHLMWIKSVEQLKTSRHTEHCLTRLLLLHICSCTASEDSRGTTFEGPVTVSLGRDFLVLSAGFGLDWIIWFLKLTQYVVLCFFSLLREPKSLPKTRHLKVFEDLRMPVCKWQSHFLSMLSSFIIIRHTVIKRLKYYFNRGPLVFDQVINMLLSIYFYVPHQFWFHLREMIYLNFFWFTVKWIISLPVLWDTHGYKFDECVSFVVLCIWSLIGQAGKDAIISRRRGN